MQRPCGGKVLGRFKDRNEASATELSKGGRVVDEVAGLSLVRTVAFPLSEVGAFGRFDRRGPCSDSQERKQGELRRATALVQARIPVVAVEEVTNGIWVQLESSPQDRLTDRFHSVNIYRVPTLCVSLYLELGPNQNLLAMKLTNRTYICELGFCLL